MSQTSVTSHELAVFLSAQLAPQLSASGYRLTADGTDVVLHDRDGHESRNGAAVILDDPDDDRSIEERAATATRSVLSHVQDAVAATSRQPWPGSQTTLPLPDAQTHQGVLVAWFGDADAPVWRSADLPLSR